MVQVLTEKQDAFCQHFAVHRSAPKAYLHAYDVSPECSPGTIAREAHRLISDHRITTRISEIQQSATALTRGEIDLSKLQQMLVDVIAVDPNELTSLRVGNCRHCWGDGGEFRWREREYMEAVNMAAKAQVDLPAIAGGFGYRDFDPPNTECQECNGRGEPKPHFSDTRYLSPGAKLLYQGVKVTKNGLEIIFSDRQKYIEMLARIIGAFNDKLTLTGQIGIAAAVATIESNDIHAATAAYEHFLQSGRESS